VELLPPPPVPELVLPNNGIYGAPLVVPGAGVCAKAIEAGTASVATKRDRDLVFMFFSKLVKTDYVVYERYHEVQYEPG
jgi:hypothetical protein